MARPPPTRAARIRDALTRHERELVAFAARITGDAERGRDVVQDTFLRLCERQPERADGDPEALRRWLFCTCRNRALDVCKKERRMEPTPEPNDRIDLGPDTDPSTHIERGEAFAALRRLVDRLPERQREAVHLKFVQGLSYREIAETTGSSIGNVGFVLHTALASLRQRSSHLLQEDPR